MPARVVHLLEVVEIEEVYGKPASIVARLDDRPRVVVELVAVGQFDQRIEVRHPGDHLLAPAPLADVLGDHAAPFHRLMGHGQGHAGSQLEEEFVGAGCAARPERTEKTPRIARRKAALPDTTPDQAFDAATAHVESLAQVEQFDEPFIRDEDAAPRVEHAQAVWHVGERGIETLGDGRCPVGCRDRVEQRIAEALGNEIERDEKGVSRMANAI